jgi:hypothetical protein
MDAKFEFEVDVDVDVDVDVEGPADMMDRGDERDSW